MTAVVAMQQWWGCECSTASCSGPQVGRRLQQLLEGQELVSGSVSCELMPVLASMCIGGVQHTGNSQSKQTGGAIATAAAEAHASHLVCVPSDGSSDAEQRWDACCSLPLSCFCATWQHMLLWDLQRLHSWSSSGV